MPIQFGIVTASGKRVERVWMQQREQTFRFPVDGQPLLVRFDEGNQLLCEFEFPRATEELLYQLQNDDVTGRIWAAGQLARRTQDSRVLPALQHSASSDPFWAVRREALRATAEAGAPALVDFWKRRALDEKSAVRVAAVQLLASRRDPSLRDWFLERFRNDDSYLVQAEALRGLGGCGAASDIEVLRSAASQPSPRDVLRKAAVEALEQLGVK